MNKKLMAVAVAGALAAPVAMAQSNVTISGRISMGVDSYSAQGATTAGSGLVSRNRVWDNGSRLVIEGNEDLGNGLKAIFYTETGFNADNGLSTANNGAASTNVGNIGSRLAFAGVQGGFGKLTFGRQHVFWTNGKVDVAQNSYIQAGTPWTAGGFGSGMGVGVARTPNVVQYASPNFNGFEAILSWSPNRQESVQTTTSGGSSAATVSLADAKGRIWGLTAQWTGGPYQVAYDWVEDRGNGQVMANTGTASAGAVVTGTNTGHKVRAAWSYQPGASIGLIWARSEVKNGGAAQTIGAIAGSSGLGVTAGSGTTLKQSAWTLSWEHLSGNIRYLAHFAKAGNVRGCEAAATITYNGVTGVSACDNTSAKAYMLGLQYLLSKRTSVNIAYNAINNAGNVFHDYSTGGNTGFTTVAGAGITVGSTSGMNGADPRIFGVGLQHNF